MAKLKVPAWQRLADKTSCRGQRSALAMKLGITRQHMSLLCLGKSRPSLDLAARLELETGIPAVDFAKVA